MTNLIILIKDLAEENYYLMEYCFNFITIDYLLYFKQIHFIKFAIIN